MSEKCHRCGKSVYANDKPQKIGPSGDPQVYHMKCFTCKATGTKLTHRTAVYYKGEIYDQRNKPEDTYHGIDGNDTSTTHIKATQKQASGSKVEKQITSSGSGYAHIPDHIRKAQTGLGKTNRMDSAGSGSSGYAHIPEHIAKAKTETGLAARGMYQSQSTGYAHIPDHIKRAENVLGSPTKFSSQGSSGYAHIPDHIKNKPDTGLNSKSTPYSESMQGSAHIPDHIKNKPDAGNIANGTYTESMQGSAHIPDHVRSAQSFSSGARGVSTYEGATKRGSIDVGVGDGN